MLAGGHVDIGIRFRKALISYADHTIVASPMAAEILDEDTVETSVADVIPIDRTPCKSPHNMIPQNRETKSPGKRKRDLANLPTVNVYELDVNELNRLYGENNWRMQSTSWAASAVSFPRMSYWLFASTVAPFTASNSIPFIVIFSVASTVFMVSCTIFAFGTSILLVV